MIISPLSTPIFHRDEDSLILRGAVQKVQFVDAMLLSVRTRVEEE